MSEGRLERLVRLWQGRLGLERWKVDVDFLKPADDGNQAEVEKSRLYDTATVRFEPSWRKWAVGEAEQVVVHELLHLLHRDVDEAFADLEGQLQRDAWTMAERRYRQAMEAFVDRAACRLVEVAGSSGA